jgi:hypothetical protein
MDGARQPMPLLHFSAFIAASDSGFCDNTIVNQTPVEATVSGALRRSEV